MNKKDFIDKISTILQDIDIEKSVITIDILTKKTVKGIKGEHYYTVEEYVD